MLPTGAEHDSSLLTNGQQNGLSQLTNGVYPSAGKDGNTTNDDHSKYLLHIHEVGKHNVEPKVTECIKSFMTQCEVEKTFAEATPSLNISDINKQSVEKCHTEVTSPEQNKSVSRQSGTNNGLSEDSKHLDHCVDKKLHLKNDIEQFKPSLNEKESFLKEKPCIKSGLTKLKNSEVTQSSLKKHDVETSEFLSPQSCPPSPSPSPHKDLSSPEECWYNAEMDSGHSTAPSPDTAQSTSPRFPGTLQFYASEILPTVATHRGVANFVPRHSDEMQIFVGDPVFVQKECLDFWFEGVNLRTCTRGVFPCACVKDVRSSSREQLEDCEQVVKERCIMDFLGSAEVTVSKGNDMLCKAIEMVSNAETSSREDRISCVLEICELGIKVVNCKDVQVNENVPDVAYYFNLQNVTFCGYHPSNERHFAFVTKHPSQSRFACHVFDGHTSTHHIADVVGVAFQKLLERFVGAVGDINPSKVDT